MKNVKKLDLIFTRDFSLFTCIFWRDQLLLKDIKKVWGVKISDQIIHFNGKLVESYRIHAEVEEMKNYVINLPINDALFSLERRRITISTVKKIKILINRKTTKNYSGLLDEIFELWAKMYPGYMLANFLPGPWAKDFRQVNGEKCEKLIKEFFKLRLKIEGIFELIDLFVRKVVAEKLKSLNIDPAYARFLTFSEIKKIFTSKHPININKIKERQKGYVIIGGKLYVNKSFPGLLQDANYNFDFFKRKIKFFKGQSAYVEETIQGKAFLIFLSHHINNFPEGGILVAPMTAPNFLPAMKKAVAIVTDEGGLTCHAAITARELKKPTLIATKIATKVIKNGDIIKVDTKKGIVEIIKSSS